MSKIRSEIAGAVDVTIDNLQVRLKLTLEALALFEEHAGAGPRMSAKTFRTLVWALMVDAQPDTSVQSVGRLIDAEIFERMSAAVAEAIRIGFGEQSHGTPAGDHGKLDWWLVWSFGRHDLGLADAEFWRMTPRQFGALAERHAAAYERDLSRSALICATLANIHRDGEKHPEPFVPADFMPQFRQREGDEQARKLAEVKRLQAKAMPIIAMLGGKIQGATDGSR